MMQHAQDGRNGSSDTFGAGYPALTRIALRKLYLARMSVIYLGLVAFGVATVVFVLWIWPQLDEPIQRPKLITSPAGVKVMLAIFTALGGLPLIALGLYILVSGGIRVAKGRTGIMLDADGYTDATTLQLKPVSISWENVRSIAAEIDKPAFPAAYVRVGLTDDSAYQSYSLRTIPHMTYVTGKNYGRYAFHKRFHWKEPDFPPSIEVGLCGKQHIIMAVGLPVDAQDLAALMNSYFKAWCQQHHHAPSRRKRVAAGNPANGRARSSLAGGTEDG
jgi:hypothetical protein